MMKGETKEDGEGRGGEGRDAAIGRKMVKDWLEMNCWCIVDTGVYCCSHQLFKVANSSWKKQEFTNVVLPEQELTKKTQKQTMLLQRWSSFLFFRWKSNFNMHLDSHLPVTINLTLKIE